MGSFVVLEVGVGEDVWGRTVYRPRDVTPMNLNVLFIVAVAGKNCLYWCSRGSQVCCRRRYRRLTSKQLLSLTLMQRSRWLDLNVQSPSLGPVSMPSLEGG